MMSFLLFDLINMLHSLVLNSLPKLQIYPAYLSGRHLHTVFLTLISSVDKTLGDRPLNRL